MRKYAVVILNQLNNNKIDKDNFEKKIITKKKPCGEHCSNPQCFKKNYKIKFSTSSIFKKSNQQKQFCKKKDNFGKKIKNKKIEKKHVEKAKAKFSTSSILKK